MTLLLLGLFLLSVLSVFLIVWGYHRDSMVALVLGMLGVTISVPGLMVYVLTIYSWVASGYKADIINAEYNTKYTQAQIFYASDVIETIRNLNRNKHELQVK